MHEREKPEAGEKERKGRKDLQGELLIVLPFFIFSLYIFFGGFQYPSEARIVPMIISFATAVLTGLRLFHIVFHTRLGQFKEAGIAGEFDSLKEEIAEEVLKGKIAEVPARKITFREERKAFLALLGSFVAFLLFGYLNGIFFVIIGISYYYGYREKKKILISLVAMYLLCYGILHKLLGAPADYGILLAPLLKSFRVI